MFKNTKKYAITNAVLLDGTEHMTPQTGKIVCASSVSATAARLRALRRSILTACI